MVASSRTKSYGRWQAARPRVKEKVRTSTDSFEERPNAGTLLSPSRGSPPVPATGRGVQALPRRLPELGDRVLEENLPILDTDTAPARSTPPCGHRGVGVVHDVPLHGFVIGGYTRDGDAEPGSRCESDTVLATVTRELGPHVATGPTGLGRQG
jgi:hypothetical protein